MTFKKGQSGNPGGRPKLSLIPWKARTRHFLESEGIDRIEQLARSKDENVALKALIFMADHAYGKPQQFVDLSGDVDARVVFEVRYSDLALPGETDDKP